MAILFEFDDTWGRNVVKSIARFAHDENWHLLLAPRDSERRLRVPESWQGDGLIVSLRDASMIAHVKSLGVPAVDVENMFPEETWLGRVATNDRSRAKMAVDHFRSRQIQHFACYSPQIGRYSSERSREFHRAVTEAGHTCIDYNQRPDYDEPRKDELAEWLKSLPRPVGIFASDPYPARQLAESCVRSGIEIPSGVSIISGDEDELLCGVLRPQISSVELASQRVGAEAALMLEGMMQTGKTPEIPLLLDPLRICSRRSTDCLAIDDEELSRVVRVIWEQAPDGIQVTDLVRETSYSRRTLEQRFRETLGCTPAEEIRRVKVERARQMIVTTSKSVAAIALDCGFSSGPYLAQAFRKQYGITPTELRTSGR